MKNICVMSGVPKFVSEFVSYVNSAIGCVLFIPIKKELSKLRTKRTKSNRQNKIESSKN